ncbi:hypothetical protein AB0L44_19330 [Nonomuraea wenchangensis]|uniref:hypothetical protein n=1 Tax=Nonomuraea wenchangensis TaxID=568860 RepID=UPI00343A001C
MGKDGQTRPDCGTAENWRSEMLPGVNEASAVVRAGVTVLQAARSADRAIDWPSLHEGLLELHAILDDWCTRTEETSSRAKRKRARIHSTGVFADGGDGRVYQSSRFVDGVVLDVDGALNPKPPLLQRWRASARREAGRRSLRTLLRVYCPELLEQFIDAFEDRAEWVLKHQGDIDQWFDGSRSDDELDELMGEMDDTARHLRQARDQLRAFIVANYPIWMRQG